MGWWPTRGCGWPRPPRAPTPSCWRPAWGCCSMSPPGAVPICASWKDPAAMAPTIVIAAGGTAGHVVPALAVADALRAEGARVVFVGGERAERTMVPEAGYELRPIAVEGLSRSNPLKAARAALKAVRAVGTARRILRDVRPDAVLG